MIRYAVNVSILFREMPYLERFAAARAAGFDAVETWWPSGVDHDEIVAAVEDADVDVVLMNLGAGEMASGDRGLLADPLRTEEFERNLPEALDLARRVRAPRVNALVGLALAGADRADQLRLVTTNLRRVADAASESGIAVLIEAINTIENGPYLVATSAEADALRRQVARSNVWLQYDAYHMQRMEGDVLQTIERYLEVIAHVQIADSPGRNQPGTGEIPYPSFLARLEALGYAGHVALEYQAPDGDTSASLEWLPRSLRSARAAGAGR